MAIQAIREFRIGEGGLLRRFEAAAHLERPATQIATALAVFWLPVVVLSLINERLTGRREPLVHAPDFHVRLLVAVPVLLALDHVFPRVCRDALGQLLTQSFVPDIAEGRLDRLLRRATRMADSTAPELMLLAGAVALGIAELAGLLPLLGRTRDTGLSAAHIWYAVADVPFVQFLLWRSLWRWAIWVRVLIGLSRIELALVPSHPDRRGGISFLRLPSIGYCSMLLFAISSMLCAGQVKRFTASGVTLGSFTPLLLAFAAGGVLIAFGPLMLFAPQLVRTRREGVKEFGRLGSEYGRRFQYRWFAEHRPGAGIGPRSTQPLADLSIIYRDTVDRVRFVLFDKRDMVALLVATLLPMVPVLLIRVPRSDWKQLLALVTGAGI